MNKMIPPRRMLPRWHDSASAVTASQRKTPLIAVEASTAAAPDSIASFEMPPNNSNPPRWEAKLERELTRWRRNPNVGTAADILSFAVYAGAQPKLKDVAFYLLKASSAINSPALLELADMVLSDRDELIIIPETTLSPMEAIRKIRGRLRAYPANPIALADIAWVHASLGHARAAYRALLAAKTLAPTNRHIVQALCRYLVHTGDAFAAQQYLEKTPSIRQDPWLLSALIAVSQITGKPTRLIKHARGMLSAGTVAPMNLSELAGSFATLEVAEGNIKAARRLFDIALVEPTENVLAQLHWVAEETGRSFEIKSAWKDIPRAFELQAFQSFVECDVEATLAHAWDWHQDEPFSSRPLVLASFLLDMSERDDDAIFTCRAGLLSNPDDAALQNNLIYSLIVTGQLDEAQERLNVLLRMDPSIQALANAGYLYLRIGQEAEGRLCYEKAVELFHKKGDAERAAMVLAFYARSLRDTGFEGWNIPLEKARESNMQLLSPAVAMVLNTISRTTNSAEKLAARRNAVRNSSWRFDKITNTLIVKPTKLLQLR